MVQGFDDTVLTHNQELDLRKRLTRRIRCCVGCAKKAGAERVTIWMCKNGT